MVHGTVEGPASSQPGSKLEAEESTRFIEVPRSRAAAPAHTDRDLLGMLAPAELTLRMSPAAKRGFGTRPTLPPHDAGELTRIGMPRPPPIAALAPIASAWPPPESLRALPEPVPATPRVVFATPPLEPGTLVAEPTPVTVRDPLSHARAQDAHYGRWAAGFLLSLGALFVISLFVPHGARHASVGSAPVGAAVETTEAPVVPAAPPAFTLPTAVVVTADLTTPPAEPVAPVASSVRPVASARPGASVRPADGRLIVVTADPHRPGGRRMADLRAPKVAPMTPAEIEQFKRDPHGYMKHLEP